MSSSGSTNRHITVSFICGESLWMGNSGRGRSFCSYGVIVKLEVRQIIMQCRFNSQFCQ